MSSAILDNISPTLIGSDMIDISVSSNSKPLIAGKIITLEFGYARTRPIGVVKPLKLQVQPAFGSGAGYFEVLFDEFVPDSYAFQAAGAGQYLAVIKEVGHNRWQGRLLINVVGDQFQEVRVSR